MTVNDMEHNMNLHPIVSIIMPACNAEFTISEAINSVRYQCFTRWELLVIDDHSTDKTKDIVNNFSKKDGRIKLIQNDGEHVSSARNTGIEVSLGKYLAFLDADDIYYDKAISTRINFLEKHNRCNAVFCKVEIVGNHLEALGWQIGFQNNVTFNEMHTCPFHINSVMLKKKCLGTIRFPVSYKNGEDWLFFQRLARTGIIFHHIKGCYATYRQHVNSTVQKDFNKHSQTLEKVLSIIYESDPECPTPAPRFAKGLRKPSLHLVLLKRRFSNLIVLILEGKLIDAKEMARTLESQYYTDIHPIEYYFIIKYTSCRFFVCHKKEWKQYWKKYQLTFLNILDTYGPTENHYPSVNDKLINILNGIDNEKILSAKLKLWMIAPRAIRFLDNNFFAITNKKR